LFLSGGDKKNKQEEKPVTNKNTITNVNNNASANPNLNSTTIFPQMYQPGYNFAPNFQQYQNYEYPLNLNQNRYNPYVNPNDYNADISNDIYSHPPVYDYPQMPYYQIPYRMNQIQYQNYPNVNYGPYQGNY
jgi:hypothetical protein